MVPIPRLLSLSFVLGFLAFFLCAAGCGNEGGQHAQRADAGAGGQDAAVRESARVKVGPEGGEVSLPDGTGAAFPPGAVLADTEVTLERVAARSAGSPPADALRLGDTDVVLRIDPKRIKGRFSVTFTVSGSAVPSGLDPTRLFLAQQTELVDTTLSEPLRIQGGLPTTAAPAGDGVWRLAATLPPPAQAETRLAAWLAAEPLGWLPVAADLAQKPAVQPRQAPIFMVSSPGIERRLLDRVLPRIATALAQSERFFRGRGYVIPAAEIPVKVWLAKIAAENQLAEFCIAGDPTYCTRRHSVWAIGYGLFLDPFKIGAALDQNPGTLEVAVAHELFHGFQYWMTDLSTISLPGTAWFKEGTASLMMDEAFDGYASWFVCPDLTGSALDSARGRRCVERAYETHPFFRWLGAGEVRQIMEEASQAVAAGITPSFADLTISRLSQERRFYKFLEDFTYLKQTDRSDSTPDARGQMVGEDLVLRDPENRADLWSSCRMGSPFDFVDVAQINADASCPPVGIAQSGVFVRSGVSDAQARRGEWLVLGGDVERLAGYRFDLQNRTGRRQRALLLVEGTGPAAAALEAAAYLPGTAAPFCHAERLDRRFECTHETGDPALAANGTTVVLIANNQTAADPARIRMALTWRMLPVALQKISGDEPLQEGPPGSALPLPLVVEARDASGVPMGGASVAFRVTSGGGTVAPAAAATDPATGRAQTTLTLGPEPGESTVQAEARDVLGRNVGVVSFRALATGQACGPTAACDPACPDGYTCCRQADCAHLEECPGECVLLASDPRNCGCCGQRCEALNLAGGPQAACCGGRCAMQPRLDQTTDPVSVRYAACCGRARLDELCVTQKAAIFGYSHDGYFLAEAYCPAGQELVKVDLATDARNCGSCGNDCGPISCCLGWCADLQTDIGNCGRCFNRCPGPAPLCCHGQCMQLSSEPAHCLGCDVPCSDGFRCVAQYGCLPADQPPPEPRACQPDEITCGALCYPRLGAFHCGSCEQTCLSSFQACYEDTCVEPMNFDSAHCLAGGGDWVNYSGACPAGTECCFGSCYTAAELEALGSCGGCLRYCKMGEACCGGRCVNTKFDDRHCNACSTSCPAGRTCCAGACVDTQTDEGSCGGCLKRCLPGQQCCAGRCHDAASAPPGCE